MSWISYAQNYEDVTLMRALRGVRAGFYIDVGAHDPRADSVTRAFYEQGWRGINVEPVGHWHARLLEDRPRDVNLCVAAGEREGAIVFHEVEGTGLSTTDEELAARHGADGLLVHRVQATMRTLDSICREHHVREVHFMKIDAEGAEAAVLRGVDLTRVRPWVVVVEATQPRSPLPSHAEWEHLVTGRGYRFAWFDGLNRFYVADEHADLADALARPPSVFDDFIPYREQQLRDDVAWLQRMREQERQVGADARRRLADVLASRSWRVTAPLRWLGTLARRAAGAAPSAASSAGVAQRAQDGLRQPAGAGDAPATVATPHAPDAPTSDAPASGAGGAVAAPPEGAAPTAPPLPEPARRVHRLLLEAVARRRAS